MHGKGGGARRLKGRGEGVPATWRRAMKPPRWCPPRFAPFGGFLAERGDQADHAVFGGVGPDSEHREDVGERGFPKGEN